MKFNTIRKIKQIPVLLNYFCTHKVKIVFSLHSKILILSLKLFLIEFSSACLRGNQAIIRKRFRPSLACKLREKTAKNWIRIHTHSAMLESGSTPMVFYSLTWPLSLGSLPTQ
jgi:hypothetical protein